MKRRHVSPALVLLLAAGCEAEGPRREAAAVATCDPAAGVPAGAVVVRLEDELIVPDTVRLQSGEPVELLVCNTGDYQRELLIGRGRAASGFADAFFRGLTVTEMQGGVLAAEWPARSPESPLTAAPADAPHAHANVTFLLQPGDSASLRFVPPAEKRGHWRMGSFRAQRYESGTIGAWIVE